MLGIPQIVEGIGIVNLRGNSPLLQFLYEVIPFRMPQTVDVVNVITPLLLEVEIFFKALVVPFCYLSPPAVVLLDPPQGVQTYHSLKLRKAEVESRFLPKVEEGFYPIHQKGVFYGYSPTLAHRNVFGRVEAKSRGVAPGARLYSLVRCTVGLGGILDYVSAVFLGEFHNGGHIGHIPEEVNGHYNPNVVML